jgi:hypothetical protein
MELVPMDISNNEELTGDIQSKMVVSMDIDSSNPWNLFLASKSFISSLSEGYFAVLMNDLRKEIWAHIGNDKTFASAMRVNKRWKVELEAAWIEFCKERNFFDEFWSENGKDWKWMLMPFGCFPRKLYQ